MRRSLIKIEHLKRRDDISRLFKYGKKIYTANITARWVENSQLNNRFIFVPQRNFGLSVSRNLIRRRLNEICRVNQHKLLEHFDVALFVKKNILNLTYSQLESCILDIFFQMGIVNKKYG